MTLFAFKVVGTVEADSMDSALAALAAYTDPTNEALEGEWPDTAIQTIRYEWDVT